jgi:hypothetical protein
MSRVEARLRRKGGLPNTLIERTEKGDGRKKSVRPAKKRLRRER